VDFGVGPVSAVEVDIKVPGLGTSDPETLLANAHADDMSVDAVEMSSVSTATEVAPVAGVKRPFEADTTVDEDYVGGDDVDAETASAQKSLAFKVNADGTVEQEDTVR
jgi:hypothetical protein